jgi:hypothetical protein
VGWTEEQNNLEITRVPLIAQLCITLKNFSENLFYLFQRFADFSQETEAYLFNSHISKSNSDLKISFQAREGLSGT